jgi:hypothetical protein
MELPAMGARLSSLSPSIVLRISNGTLHTHRAFSDFGQAVKSAEAYAGAGYSVVIKSATGQFLFGYEPDGRQVTA